ncbi:MAG: riboflavin synthase, partial [Deltaproteobacteria bacterium]|nr:riboflavin synthase [Deltaproteobacteria bacterium]
MFTGIIEGTGIVKSVVNRDKASQVEIQAHFDLADTNVGESLAVNGCCLTITSRLGNTVWVDISEETAQMSTLGVIRADDWLNLERPLRYGGRAGG